MTSSRSTGAAVLDAVLARGVIPVVSLDNPATAADVGQALVAGGLPVAEVTLRSELAEECLHRMAQVPHLLVGAGTVVRPDQVDRVHQAGARFVVSPGLDPQIVERCRELGLAVLPGVATATEVQSAARLDLDVVKFFPAAAAGGTATIAALAGPFPKMRFVPTGGIDAGTMAAYLAIGCVAAVGGSWIATRKAVAEGDWAGIEAEARRAVESAGQARA